MSRELLRRSPLFGGLAEEDLERLYHATRRVTLAPGDTLVTEGEPADAAYLALEGTFEVTRRSGDREFVIDQRAAGDLMGELALLENARRSASVRAATDAVVLEITRETFQAHLRKSPGAALAVLQTVAARLRHSEVMLRHNEKMVALGTLSAGLAHELNNPAAAVQRSAAQLQEAMAAAHRCTADLAAARLSAAQTALAEDLQDQLPARLVGGYGRDPLERDEAESELSEWLEGLGVTNAWEVAPPIAAAGWNVGDLKTLTEDFSARQQIALARWLASTVVAYTLLHEVSQGASRIAEIVASVRSYAYLDRAPVQLVDIHEGLENTLGILRHKLEPGVQVGREYDRGLPRIEGYGGELNQVWTNLLDNAIDAMDGRGLVRIHTYAGKSAQGVESAVIEISDTGPGISPAIQDRIFEAFFTTKEPGQGAGLGLHVVYDIVVNRHGGEIAVQSQPGETTFIVTLPVRLRHD